ncbi:phage tail tape measure C-terminal domain-containing protein, partial [Pseudomonas aeruginosa]
SQYGDGSRGMSLDEYNDKLKALEANHAAMTQQLQRNYADLQAAQGNWVNGATSAFADYIDSARDVAGQTYELFSNAFS